MDNYEGILKDWNVLVVDDDPISLDIAELVLMHYGAAVHTAGNGQEGLDRLKNLAPDFIITDLSMPVLDGWGLIKAAKSDPRTASIPIIALTAHAMIGDREKAIAAGCHNYLTKPLTADSLIADLVNLLTDIPELEARLHKSA